MLNFDKHFLTTMKQKEVFNKIGVIIKEITDQYKYLETNPDDLNALELELFVANAHFLADHAEILNKLNTQANTQRIVAKNEEAVRKEKYFEPVVRQPEPEKPEPVIDTPAAEAKDSFSFIMDEPEVIRHELTADDIPGFDEETEYPEEEEVLEEEVAEDEVEQETALPPVPEKPEPIEVELPVTPVKPAPAPEPPKQETPKTEAKAAEAPAKEDKLTVNQRISAQLSASKGGTEPAPQPISDLKQAINLNDKMLYVKELFNGYSLAYSEAIEILNRFQSFEEADRFLNKNYVTKNNWESKKDTTEKFYAILKRRYL